MSSYDTIKSFLTDIGCAYCCDEPMSRHTSFKIGGNADLFVTPENEQQASAIIKRCRELEIKYYLIGNGSNLLVSDEGLRGVVIAFTKAMGDITVCGNTITAQAGALLSTVCRTACENNLSGMEFAFGIPGSIGGAIFMNAGAYGGEMKDITVSVRALFPNGEIYELDANDVRFGYRMSIFQKNSAVILSAKFELKADDKAEIESRMNDILQRRKDKQPLEWPSAGSAFKRPKDGFAAALIDECGLKGFTVGGAQVSEKHAGFVINRNNATCKDVIELLGQVKGVVFGKTGVLLEPEIKQLG